jgi:hypothetical protein
MTRRLLLVALCVCWAPLVKAQEPERFDTETAQKLGKELAAVTAKLTDLPVKLALDDKQATGMKSKEAGLLLVPDSKLTADALKKIDREVVPVGAIYFRKITPVVADEPVAADNHRTVEATINGKAATVTVVPLAAARVAGRLVLLAYTKGKTPALVTDLAEIEEKIDLPLDVTPRRGGDRRATLLINVLGKYRAAVPVAAQE